MTAQIATGRTAFRSSVEHVALVSGRTTLSEENFWRMILIERKRTERSGYPFLLMLIDGCGYQAKDNKSKDIDTMMAALLLTTRETDFIGWYKDQVIVGAIFTGLECEDKKLILEAILKRVTNALQRSLTREQLDRVSVSFHFFPNDWDHVVPPQSSDSAPHSDLSTHHAAGQEATAKHIAVIETLSTDSQLCRRGWWMSF